MEDFSSVNGLEGGIEEEVVGLGGDSSSGWAGCGRELLGCGREHDGVWKSNLGSFDSPFTAFRVRSR